MTLQELAEAIKSVVEYNWADEARDFEENPSEAHIFVQLVKLDNWANGTSHSISHYTNVQGFDALVN